MLKIAEESSVDYADFGFSMFTFTLYWCAKDESNPEKFGFDEPYILLGSGEICAYEDGFSDKTYKLCAYDIPENCFDIHYVINELERYLDSHGFKREIDHLKDLPRKERQKYRQQVCAVEKFSTRNDSLSYAKIKYLFDNNTSERISEWLNGYLPEGGYYSNKELDEIRDILNKL